MFNAVSKRMDESSNNGNNNRILNKNDKNK